MRYGILFSGQGAQRSGMGVELMADSLFSRIVNQASEFSNLDLLKIMKNEHNELNKTQYVQPALVTVSYGIFKMLKRDLPDFPIAGMIGLSLGEYAALLASGALPFNEGIRLVTDRAKFMQEDADKEDTTLAAILNPQISAIEELIQKEQKQGKRIYIANYNSPRQIVIGGSIPDLQEIVAKLQKESLAKKSVILKVNGAFHTPFFDGARQKMHTRLQEVHFQKSQTPVISNTINGPFTVNNLSMILERQLAVPTHFGDNLQYLVKNEKVNATLEIGPGKTLTRFAHQVGHQLKESHIANLDDYKKFVKEQQDGIKK
ncbi:ACP S-malonyltransferase [Limosilactobacillus sp. WF-MT5-A]|uniref:ACP S-malonyltransferase n=1 Tax=Limosilactobacillus agrestis TaxID=2759748 RepID=UPI0015FD3B75|nr:ACP S-malonyltransferase [Limosilactobacillus agrestis]MBB1100032.1 ACP S-malonyltransferase [Limosilactobacillus agrestis]MCD7127161.1 ACP S-malonyltransferase [Limosilactobacillus agrestis]